MNGIPLPMASVRWGADLHAATGNLLFSDGSVEQTDTAAMRHSLLSHPSESQEFHFLSP